MFYLPDFHMHSAFSSDAKTSLDKMISCAKQRGLSAICFTEHNDFDYPPEDGQAMFQLDLEHYLEQLDQYRCQTAPNGLQPAVYAGVEQGLSPAAAERINSYDNEQRLDFIIGSSHLVDGADPYYPGFWENRTVTDAVLSYFESICSNLKVCHNFDVYGHLDYVIRYAPGKDAHYNWLDYSDLLDSILSVLIQSGKGIEVNTSGLKSGLRFPNPCFGILQRYRRLGGEIITTGSDAHHPDHIGYRFDILPDMLKSAGFRYYTIFVKRKPLFYPIP